MEIKKECVENAKTNGSNTGLFVLLAGIILLFGFVLYTQFAPFESSETKNSTWKLIVDDKDGISVEVQPAKLSHVEDSEFSVTFTTHEGSLDFDPSKISVLSDNVGKKYLPIKWEGSPTGGHHRNGRLIFPKLSDSAMEVKLLIRIGKSERIFEWGLH